MSNLIIPGVGAVVGYMVGGPTGAQIGWAAGSALQASRQEIRQGTVGDLRIQTASYGTGIPVVIGKQRVSGNIIWAAEKKVYEIKSRQGKGGQKTVTNGYTGSMLIGICAGPILGISRVWADGDLIVDGRTAVKPLIGELYLGTQTQLADPTYESVVGIGNAPAYRGLAYISLTNFDLGVSGRTPQFSFEVVKGAEL
jgi:hypothetical protein